MRTKLAPFVLALLLSAFSFVSAAQIPASWYDDAELRDIHFVDEDYGWAVGDHGTIWHTQNGGEIWRRQESTVACQLNSVFFVDRNVGYAAGGVVIPLTHRSKVVLLRTKDGGRTWTETGGLLLPMVTQIHFASANRGYAVGMSSPSHPSGAWTTRDAGRTWSPLPGVAGEHWTSADFMVGRAKSNTSSAAVSGLLLSKSGKRAWLAQDRLMHARAGESQNPTRRAAFGAIASSSVAFAGATFPEVTGDGGNSWQPVGAMTEYPQVWEQGLEARTMAAVKGNVWVAGSPGTRILHSNDMGGTWQAVATPTTLPIRRLRFVDAKHGWAVGSRGLILSTKDGGATWKQQRGGAKRMALVGLFATEADVAWDLLTQVSAQHAYRIHIVVLASRLNDDVLRSEAETRLEAAAMQVGASAEILTRLPYANGVDRPANELLSDWQRLDEKSIEKLLGRLTRMLRVYRPDVVVTSRSIQTRKMKLQPNGAQQLLSRLMLDSIDFASNPEIRTEQLELLGLQPWKVSKTLAVQASEGRPIQLDAVASVTGTSVGDLSRRAQRLSGVAVFNSAVGKKAWSLFTLDRDNETSRGKDVGRHPLSSTSIQYDSAQRRPRAIQSINVATQKKSLQRLTQTRRIVSSARIVGRGTQRIEQIERLLGDDRQMVGDLLFELAQEELSKGDDGEAATILQHLAKSHREHSLADKAMHWLMAYHSSVERLWRDKDLPSAVKLSPVTQSPVLSSTPTRPEPIRLASAELPFELDDADQKAVPTDAQTESGTHEDLDESFERSVEGADSISNTATNETPAELNTVASAEPTEPPFDADLSECFKLARDIKSKRPELYSEPSILFPLASASWVDGQTKAAKGFFQRQTSLPEESVWRNRAIRELRLAGVVENGASDQDESTGSTTATWPCEHITTRPHLDGKLNDDCWRPEMVLELKNESGKSTTQVVLAFDDEYLYVAAACPKRAEASYLPQRRPRPRDADLSELDRLRISLDINRDYASCWSIEIDHRGWTRDALRIDLSDGDYQQSARSKRDSKWNPEYFVASDSDEKTWTIEAAIPLDQLAPAEYRSSVWAVGVERIVPKVGVERPSGSSTQAAVSAKSPALQGVIQLGTRKISP